jgi:catechol 2,3-dioxygenase-like lactoylglutathione lyase family enzyme
LLSWGTILAPRLEWHGDRSMKKRAVKKASAKKSGRAPSKKSASAAALPATNTEAGKLSFNHAMIYVKDVDRSLGFYAGLLGFKLIEDFRYEGKAVYARLRAPGNDGTLALHLAGPDDSVASNGVRLYFEVGELDDFCRKLQQKNFYITKMPQMMPWGWRHAYLNDPDGHEISLYFAGANRMKKSVISTAKKAARA